MRLFFANRDAIALKKPFCTFREMRFLNNSAAKVIKMPDAARVSEKQDARVEILFFRPLFSGLYSRSGQFSRRSGF